LQSHAVALQVMSYIAAARSLIAHLNIANRHVDNHKRTTNY